MAMLMIRCPRTGLEVPTEIETDPHSFQTIPDVLIYTRCPHCKIDHAWWPDEAWLTHPGSTVRQEIPTLRGCGGLIHQAPMRDACFY